MPVAASSTAASNASRLDDPRDQAQAQRLVGVDDATGEQQVAGGGLADHVGQEVGPAHPGVHAQLHERHARASPRRRRTGGRRPARGRARRRSRRRSPRRWSAPRAVGSTARRGRTRIIRVAQLVDARRPARWRSRTCCRPSRTRCPRRSPPRTRTSGSSARASIARTQDVGHLLRHRVALVGIVEDQTDDAGGRTLEPEVGQGGFGSHGGTLPTAPPDRPSRSRHA